MQPTKAAHTSAEHATGVLCCGVLWSSLQAKLTSLFLDPEIHAMQPRYNMMLFSLSAALQEAHYCVLMRHGRAIADSSRYVSVSQAWQGYHGDSIELWTPK